MLFVFYLKEYTGLLQCLIIENQRNVDDMITTNQIITIFTIKVGSLSEIIYSQNTEKDWRKSTLGTSISRLLHPLRT